MKSLLLTVCIIISFLHSYSQPSVIIKLLGDSIIVNDVYTPYEDAGFTALDSANNDYSQFVTITGIVDTSRLGDNTLTYSISNNIAICSSQIRKVKVLDRIAPTILLQGSNPELVYNNQFYIDSGVKITDNFYPENSLLALLCFTFSGFSTPDGRIKFTSDSVNIGYIYYNITDPSGNTSDTATRILIRNNTTGLNELSKVSCHIYPNPARDEIHIKLANDIEQCFLINTLSQRIPLHLERDIEGFKANISTFQTGVYILQIESDGNLNSTKFIISE